MKKARLPLVCLLVLAVLAALPGCATLGRHEDCDGHKGIVVDAATRQPLVGAELFGTQPTFKSRVVKARKDGTFCFHFRDGKPSSMTIRCPGYKPLIIRTSEFLLNARFGLKIDTRPKSRLWGGEKEDILTPFERELLRKRGLEKQ